MSESKQPEALRLAEHLKWADTRDLSSLALRIKAAAELRRLLSEALRIEALHAQAQRELFDAKAMNQEMLYALQWIADRCPAQLADHPLHDIHKEIAYDAGVCARAALAKVTNTETN